MATKEETMFEVPFEVVKSSGGFAMDMGGSVAKVVYRDKRDWDFDKNEPKKLNGGFAYVRAFMFAREKRKDVLNYIREHCHITHATGSEILIYTTGIGGHEYGKEFGEAFNVSLKNITEMDCFIKGFRYLCQNIPENKLLHEEPARPFETMQERVEAFRTIIDKSEKEHLSEGKWEAGKQSKEEQLKAVETLQRSPSLSKRAGFSYAKQHQVFPCMLGVLGSGIGYMRLEDDGTFGFTDMSNRGGRLFLGLGSILTGVKSYEDLMELAEKGDQRKIHTYTQDYKIDSTRDQDLYGNFPQDFLVFSFGKGVDKNIGDFTKEDLARTLLHHICIDLAQTTHLALKSEGLKTVFLCGGFGNSSLVRELFTDEFLFRTLMRGEVGQREVRFVKGGGYLGALGAFLEGYKV